MIEESQFFPNGKLDEKSIFKYDKKGNDIENITQFRDESFGWKWTRMYDERRNLIEQNSYDSDEQHLYKWTYRYNKEKNLIEQTGYNTNGSINYKTHYKYEFDFNNNWIKQIEFDSDLLILKGFRVRRIEYCK